MGDEEQWPMVPRAMSVPPEREAICVPPDRATTMSVPPERAAVPRERASSLTVPSTTNPEMQEEEHMTRDEGLEPSATAAVDETNKDWWKTPYAGVSWAFHSSILGPLLSPAVATSPPATPAIDLNPALPGVRGALDTLSRYEADVGFHFTPTSSSFSYPYPTSYVYTPPSTPSSPSSLRHSTLLHAFFDGIPSPPASSPAWSPSSSSSSSSTSSSSPPRTPTTPAPLNPAARAFVSVRVRRDAQGWLVGVDELPFQPFEGDEMPGRVLGSDSDEGDPFVVRAPKAPRRRKDMLDVLARRGTPSPGMRKNTSGWIDVGPGWIDVSTHAVDLSATRRSPQKQKQPRGGRRRRQPLPQPQPQPQQQYGKLVGRDWR